jgi:Putative transposase/Transposase zinc-binding domain
LIKYNRHEPKNTLLYKIIEEHYPAFVSHLAEEGRVLPTYIHKEFEDYLKCGLLEYGFLRLRCEGCHYERLLAFSCKHRGFCPSCCAKRMTESSALLVDTVLPHQPMRQWVLSVPFPLRFLFASQPHVMSKVLGIVTRTIATYLIKKAGYSKTTARTGAVTLIQRFGSALNLNIHFHMLFLDGVYIDDASDKKYQRFVSVTLHRVIDIANLTHKISLRIARYLERAGFIVRDAENTYLVAGDVNDSEMTEHQSHSIQYRISIGSQKGKKVFALQTLPPLLDDETKGPDLLGKMAGFSLHAGVSAKASQRNKLERLCRYIARPPIAEERLSLTASGKIRYELKTPYRSGITHMIFEPLDFISKLAALIPAPRVNLIRFHGIFAPNSQHRAAIINQVSDNKPAEKSERTKGEKHGAMTWAARLKRVFNIDMTICEACGGAVKVVACIDDPGMINKILNYLQLSQSTQVMLPVSRAPPVALGFALNS